MLGHERVAGLLDEATVEAWFVAYIDLLQRFELINTATEVRLLQRFQLINVTSFSSIPY